NFLQAPAASEWVITWDAIPAVGGVRAVHIDAQDFTETYRDILAIADALVVAIDIVIVRAAAIASSDIEITIRPERDHAAVMIGLRLIDAQDFLPRVGIDQIRIGRADPPRRDRVLAIQAGGIWIR